MKAIIPGSKQAEKMMRLTILEYIMYANALVLHDLHGFGRKRNQRVVNALNDMLEGYADQDGVQMLEGMRKELKSRKIDFEIKGRR